jgi:DeoR/GlpR family transcriptional regulator of sugar metabolism
MRIRTEIRENARVTVMQLASLINRNERKIKKHLAILQQEGTIRRVGGRKFGHWEDLGPPPSP